MQSIGIKREKLASLYRRHPWIFSGALLPLKDKVADGELVYFTDPKGERLGFGHYSSGSIAIRVLAWGNKDYYPDFWDNALKAAFTVRKSLGFFGSEDTNAFRWVNGEGDALPGLVIDVYHDYAVIQCHSLGMYLNRKDIEHAILKTSGAFISKIYNKSKETLPQQVLSNDGDREESLGTWIIENGIKFYVDISEGQKTGFFLDQRDNRKCLMSYVKGKNVLNAFCYTGGFSLYAWRGKASKVVSIDLSQKALDNLKRNAAENGFFPDDSDIIKADVVQYLQQMPDGEFDVIVLDPPAFAKSLDKRHNAIQAYKRINVAAMKKIKSGGILFTFSCSQVVTEDLFYHTIVSAGIDAGRSIQILHKLSQGPDHPINLFHPEGHYLKGLVLLVQ